MPIILDNQEGCLLTGTCNKKSSECNCKERGIPHVCNEYDGEDKLNIPSIPETKIKGRTLLHG